MFSFFGILKTIQSLWRTLMENQIVVPSVWCLHNLLTIHCSILCFNGDELGAPFKKFYLVQRWHKTLLLTLFSSGIFHVYGLLWIFVCNGCGIQNIMNTSTILIVHKPLTASVYSPIVYYFLHMVLAHTSHRNWCVWTPIIRHNNNQWAVMYNNKHWRSTVAFFTCENGGTGF